MLNFFYKAAIIIITINAFFLFLMPSSYGGAFTNQFSWLPAGLKSGQPVTNSSQANPILSSSDNNADISQIGTGSNPVQLMFTFVDFAGTLINLLFGILFGYFIWMQMIIPCTTAAGAACLSPIVLVVGIPLFLIEIIGLFTLLQNIVGMVWFAIKSIIG